MRILLKLTIVFIAVPMIGCGVRCSPLLASLDGMAASIFDGEITIDENGICDLGPNTRVVDNVAYVTIQPDGTKLVLFRGSQGKGSNFSGILYTNGPPLLIGTEISLVSFELTDSTNELPVGMVDATIGSKIADGCYNVRRSKD